MFRSRHVNMTAFVMHPSSIPFSENATRIFSDAKGGKTTQTWQGEVIPLTPKGSNPLYSNMTCAKCTAVIYFFSFFEHGRHITTWNIMNADLKTGHFAFEALRSTYVRTKERQCPPQEKENHQNLLREITNEKMWINTRSEKTTVCLLKIGKLRPKREGHVVWTNNQFWKRSLLDCVREGYTWRCRVADISKSLLEETYLTKTQRSSACWQPQIGLAWWKAEIEEKHFKEAEAETVNLLFPFIYMCIYKQNIYTYLYMETFSEMHDQLIL